MQKVEAGFSELLSKQPVTEQDKEEYIRELRCAVFIIGRLNGLRIVVRHERGSRIDPIVGKLAPVALDDPLQVDSTAIQRRLDRGACVNRIRHDPDLFRVSPESNGRDDATGRGAVQDDRVRIDLQAGADLGIKIGEFY